MTELAVYVIEALATALVKSGDISFLIDRFPRLILALETRFMEATQCYPQDG